MLRFFNLSMLSLTVLVLALAAPVAFAQTSVVTYTLDTPVTDQAVLNECNGETVTLSGTMHFEYFFSADADGDKTHYHISSTSHLTGSGPVSGANYVANETVHQEVATKDIATEQTFGTKTKLIAQGPTPNMLLRQTLHVVVDKRGNIKAEVVKNQVKCAN